MEENGGRAGKSFLAEMAPYLAGGDLQRVLDLAQSRLSKIPDDIEARAAICRVWLMQGREDEALGMIAEIEERLLGVADLYASLGDLFAKKGLERDADVFYRKFAALRPSVFDGEIAPEETREQVARQETDERYDDEEEVAVSAEFETPTLAALYLRQGHIEQAEEMLERITARDPLNERACLLLTDARRMRAQKEEKQKNAVIISTLEQWLARLERVRCHA